MLGGDQQEEVTQSHQQNMDRRMIEHSNIVPGEVSVSMSHSLFNPQKQKAVDP